MRYCIINDIWAGKIRHWCIPDTPERRSCRIMECIWNPGQSIQSGPYIFVAEDPQKSTSGRVEFSVVGGGAVSITSSRYAIAKGDTLTFSGQCTTGAQNVLLVLYGPERYSSGVELGAISVMGDKTWSFKYTVDSAAPTGSYTMNVYDIPKTTSSSTQFTVGFA